MSEFWFKQKQFVCHLINKIFAVCLFPDRMFCVKRCKCGKMKIWLENSISSVFSSGQGHSCICLTARKRLAALPPAHHHAGSYFQF